MWELKQDKVGCTSGASPCPSQNRTDSVGNSKLVQEDIISALPATTKTLLAAIFEPILYPFAVLALRILTGIDQNIAP